MPRIKVDVSSLTMDSADLLNSMDLIRIRPIMKNDPMEYEDEDNQQSYLFVSNQDQVDLGHLKHASIV